MHILYTIGIVFYGVFLRLASIFSPKAKLWVDGRRNVFTVLENHFANKNVDYWFHCASLGEFEQGRPVIEALKKKFPNCTILITFFSPSGYEVRKNYPIADFVCYLPLDTPRNAKRFLKIIQPKMVFFVKYEFWFNYINVIHNENIPFYSISAAFRKDHIFFKNYGFWFRKQLKKIDHFFVQNQLSVELLNSIEIKNVSLSGDTRYDRVSTLATESKEIPWINDFVSGRKLLVGGSTWSPDEELIAEAYKKFPDICFLIAPHNIDSNRVNSVISSFPGNDVVKLSALDLSKKISARVVIIDKIGLLNRLYRYADFAFVGGGFGTGLHNILEAATYGVPVFFGPKTDRFPEAAAIVKYGGAFQVSNSVEFLSELEILIKNNEKLKDISSNAASFVKNQAGATEVIFDYLFSEK